MYFEQIKTPGLGCYSYIIGSPSEGAMAVVDPRRDIGVYLQAAHEHDMRITHIFDTHVHADHVSGAQELRAATGADIYIHESAPVGYDAARLHDGDEFRIGNAHIRVIHTPGHTPNSVSLLVSDLARSPAPEMLLTGDLLFVGDVGRPDLPGDEILDEQAENLYDSLYKVLGSLPDYLEIYPAHGEGSLCGQGMSAKPSSTLGYERRVSPMLGHPDLASFKSAILSHLPMRPQSFSQIIATNIKGADVLNNYDNAEYALSANYIEELIGSGAVVLDVRDAYAFAAAHIPGSINVDFTGGPMLNWVGMAIAPGARLVLVMPSDDGFEELRMELSRIGYDDVKGWLAGGIDAWIDAGLDAQSFSYISASELKERLANGETPALIDVRTVAEFGGGYIPGAVNITMDRIVKMDSCPVDRDAQLVVICQSGFRAAIAASILQAMGCGSILVLAGGMNVWQ
ncbi:MAG: rhodanese-like domain-containing protein [Oscillospiraceae bacterium]|nr:rhodanese-like domain-containing protein [Oscillospiraceae bacterium]